MRPTGSLKQRASIALQTLQMLRPLLSSGDDLIYSFLSTCAQTDSIIGSVGFMGTFDFKGILESVGVGSEYDADLFAPSAEQRHEHLLHLRAASLQVDRTR